MAKRKRKMTLFDVINAGQPIGIQVRTRVPTYQPTPELPVKKKLAKLFGRKPSRDPNQPLSAAEELELLRRELGGKKAVTEVESGANDSVETEYDPTARFAETESPRPARRAVEIARDLSDQPARPPKAPRKSIKQITSEYWEKVAPRVHSTRDHISQWTTAGWRHSQEYVESLRNLNTRHAATAATILGGIIVLGGSFYVGKLLLQRPASDAALVDADGINRDPRPEVMDVDPNANSAVANVSRSVPSVSLERTNQPTTQKPPTPAPASGVFGGRSLDLNFVIVQSYYTQAEADAAVDVLAKYNIRASVEKNLPGWSSGGRDFYSVVSVDGYPKLKDNAAYQAFLSTLTKISDREAGSTLPKRLDPRPYKYVRSAT